MNEKEDLKFEHQLMIELKVDLYGPRSIACPDDFILYKRGIIQLVDENDQLTTIGELKVAQLQVELARRARLSAFCLYDSYSSTAAYLPLIKKNGDWIKAVHDDFEPFTSDLFVLDRISIEEPYRGHGLSLIALRIVLDAYADGYGLIACVPFPLQYQNMYGADEVVDIESKEAAFQRDRKRLAQYWSRLGFKPVRGANIMAMSPQWRLPTYNEMLHGIDVDKPFETALISTSPGAQPSALLG